MKFTKMHGCGNDYIYIDCTEEFVENEEKAAIILSDRHFGIGGDGIILIKKGTKADFEMVMYNADGSRGAMCGNGIRCVAKYCYDHKLTDKTTFTIESMGAVKYIDVNVENGEVKSAKVDMGKPSLKASDIPVNVRNDKAIDEPIKILDREFKMTCVSMGNPHAVVYVDDVDNLPIEEIGPKFESHERFPRRVNTEFVKVLDRHTAQMRVWERGSAETLACGTGACAVAVSCILNGLTEDEVTVKLLGGDLEIQWDQEKNTVYMTGPATFVFDGELK